MSKPFLPFWLWPGHWGLKGQTKEVARAEYELTGEELERRVAELTLHGEALIVKNINIDYEWVHHDIFKREKELAEATLKGVELEIKLLELEHKEGNINDRDLAKGTATANKESWVEMISIKPDSTKPNHGQMELDWNDFFVEELREGGYEAAEDEQVVDMWLSDLCRNVAMEQFTGEGDFDEKIPDQHIQKTPPDADGKWEAS